MPKRLKSWAIGPVEDKLERDSPSRGEGKGVSVLKDDADGTSDGTTWPGVQPAEKYCALEGEANTRAATARTFNLMMVGRQTVILCGRA